MTALIIAGLAYYAISILVGVGLGRHLGRTDDYESMELCILYAVFWPVAAPMFLAFARASKRAHDAPQGIETRRAETGTGSVHESPSGEAGAPNPSIEEHP